MDLPGQSDRHSVDLPPQPDHQAADQARQPVDLPRVDEQNRLHEEALIRQRKIAPELAPQPEAAADQHEVQAELPNTITADDTWAGAVAILLQSRAVWLMLASGLAAAFWGMCRKRPTVHARRD